MTLMPSKQIVEMLEQVLSGKQDEQRKVAYHVAELRVLGDLGKENEFRRYNSNLLSEISLLNILIKRCKGEIK